MAEEKLLKNLNKKQKEAVTFGKGPLVVLAGAGSGKTRVLTYRAAYLISKGVEPERILLMTFTNKAAGEMQERLKKLVGTSLPFAGTFHSFCAKLLRKEGKYIGISPGYVIYDDSDQLATIKLALKKLDLDPKEFRLRSVLATISAAKSELLTVADYATVARGKWQEKVARVYEEYQKLLNKFMALDFDDLLVKTVRVFEKNEQVLKQYQRQFKYVLIDEYQDTNRVQYMLSKLLAEKHKNICVVGDFSQSIYSFRGADYRNLEYLKKDFPKIKTIKLERNYRSTQNILDAAYGVIHNNKTHPILSLWTKADMGKKVSVYEAKSEKEEANFVVDKIKSERTYSDFSVLYRTNAQSRVFEEAMMRAGISYVLVGGVKFYERKEIKDVISYLRVLVNPDDQVSLERLNKIGKRRLNKFIVWREKVDVNKYSPLDLVDNILEVTGYLELFDKERDDGLMRIENIKELRSVASEFDDLTSFLENVALVQNGVTPSGYGLEEKSGKVTLMTLHASKGLEFPVVFLVGMEEGLFPHSRSMLKKEELEEERRLCYVGMTRAKEELFLTFAQKRLYFGSIGSNMISRFLGEIPEKLLDWEAKRSKVDFDMIDKLLDEEIDIDEFLES